MKNYLLVLFLVFGAGIFLNEALDSLTEVRAGGAYAESGIVTEADVIREPRTELLTLAPVPEVAEIEIEPVTEVAYMSGATKSTYVGRVNMSNASRTSGISFTSETSNGTPFYTVNAFTADVETKPDYAHIYKTNRLVYGHNTANLLGSVNNLSTGETFQVSENGVISTYRVAKIQIFKKTSERTLAPCSNYETCTNETYYIDLLQNATYRAVPYDLALMTCDGKPLEGGDATHRRFVFAYKI